MKLKIETKEGNQREFESFSERIKIGRGVSNDIILKGSYISRYHAEILILNDKYTLIDLESKNGILLNGKKLIQEMPLNVEDIIKIGDFTLHCLDFKSIELDTCTIISDKETAFQEDKPKKPDISTETETIISHPPPVEETESSFDETTKMPQLDEEATGTVVSRLSKEEKSKRAPEKDKDKKTYPIDHTKKKYWLQNASLVSLLLNKGLINEEAHRAILKDVTLKRKDIDEVLVNHGILNIQKLHDLYTSELKLRILTEKEMLAMVQPNNLDRWLAEQYGVIPLAKNNGDLSILTINPLNAQVMGDIEQYTGCRVLPFVADCSDASKWQKWIKKAYDKVSTRVQQGRNRKIQDQRLKSSEELSGIPADQLVNYIIDIALSERASDIHIEPVEHGLLVRIRVDGVMQELLNISYEDSASVALEVTSQLKVRSKCNVAEKRLPQDGRFSEGAVDFRLSTLPIIYGEKTVLRILEKEALIHLEDLGMPYNDLELLKRKISAPNGMILITGPTGSGKTTTLYSALDFLPSESLNIVTVEDPVEYRLPGVHQMQVKQKIGLTFAAGLRSILRQDPEVIMVGEIRDTETAAMAIQASLTGHVVFSTLHTNDAVGIVSRLLDMGIESYLVASAFTLGMAQRLVRKICENCKIPISLDNLISQLDKEGITETRLKANGIELSDDVEYMMGEGCFECKESGYSGRQAVYEMIDINSEIRSIIVKKDFNDEMLRDVVEEVGMSTLLTSGLDMVENGSTTMFELFRVIGEK